MRGSAGEDGTAVVTARKVEGFNGDGENSEKDCCREGETGDCNSGSDGDDGGWDVDLDRPGKVTEMC